MNAWWNIRTIAKRELGGYFASPVAYVFIVIFLLLCGFFTFMLGGFFERKEASLVSFFLWHPWLYLFLVPAVGMRLWSEERRLGTMELLLTTPVGHLHAMMGKFLASTTFLLIMLAGTWVTISALFKYGQPDWKPILGAYLGLLLYGEGLLAAGLFISTLTENQIVSGVITFGVSLVLWLIDSFSSGASGAAKDVLSYLSVIGHLDDFIKGVIDTTHVIFYLSFAFVGLFLTYRSLESMRWRS